MNADTHKPSHTNASGRRIARNSLINLLGVVLPLAAGLITIPRLISGMGTERFGILSLAWMMVGYFSFVEFGIGRAMTHHVAGWISEGRRGQVGGLIWTGVVTAVVLGITGGLVFLAIAHVVVTHTLNLPVELQVETSRAAMVLAIAIPFVLPSLALRGALQAIHRFDLVNVVRTLVGLNSFLGPLVVLQFTTDLATMMWVLVVGRVVGAALYAGSLQINIRYLGCEKPTVEHLRLLMRTGGWMVVSNIISPILVYLDRLIIAWLLGVTAIAYYFTSYEITTKVLLIPSSLVAVLFPVFSGLCSVDNGRLGELYRESLTMLFVVLFPVVVVMGMFAQELLEFWVGPEFSANGYRVMQILVLGVLANGLASIPFACLQGRGRVRVTAAIHLIELPIAVLVFYVMTRKFGIAGAAFAWTLRVCIDGVAMHWFARASLGSQSIRLTAFLYPSLATGLVTAALYLDPAPSMKLVGIVGLGVVHFWYYRRCVAKLIRMLRPHASGTAPETTS